MISTTEPTNEKQRRDRSPVAVAGIVLPVPRELIINTTKSNVPQLFFEYETGVASLRRSGREHRQLSKPAPEDESTQYNGKRRRSLTQSQRKPYVNHVVDQLASAEDHIFEPQSVKCNQRKISKESVKRIDQRARRSPAATGKKCSSKTSLNPILSPLKLHRKAASKLTALISANLKSSLDAIDGKGLAIKIIDTEFEIYPEDITEEAEHGYASRLFELCKDDCATRIWTNQRVVQDAGLVYGCKNTARLSILADLCTGLEAR